MTTHNTLITRLVPIAVLVTVVLIASSPAFARTPYDSPAPVIGLAQGQDDPTGEIFQRDTTTRFAIADTGRDGTSGKDVVLTEFDVRSDRSRGAGHSASGDFMIESTAQGSTAGFGGASDFKAGPGCSIQCITSGIAYAHGVGAKLTVKTDTPARIWISVWDNDGYAKMVHSDADDVTSFSHTFDDLEPGTSYQAMAIAEDSSGYSSHATGSFETLTRNVEISFVYADVTQKPYGQSPFWMAYYLDGEWHSQPYWYPFLDENDILYDPDWLGLGIHFITLEDVGPHLDLMIQLRQRDPGPDLCEAVPGPEDLPPSGSSGLWCLTWATASFANGDGNLDAGLGTNPNATEHTLQRTLQLPGGALPPGYGQSLNFTVPVTLIVTYE